MNVRVTHTIVETNRECLLTFNTFRSDILEDQSREIKMELKQIISQFVDKQYTLIRLNIKINWLHRIWYTRLNDDISIKHTHTHT